MMHPTRRLRDEEVALRDGRKAQADVLEKDDTELQLEKALFGDEAGFMGSLRTLRTERDNTLVRTSYSSDEEMVDSVDRGGMEEVSDEELFFLDAGTGSLPRAIVHDLKDSHGDNSEDHERKPVWIDSDDERLTISLASNTRLRKLRDTEDDDIVNGTEYIRRLRRQYERLHPMPEWVKHAYSKKSRSRDTEGATSDSDSDICIEDDLSLSSTLPLSELLRSAGDFTRNDRNSTARSSARRLRPEVLDIQRTKDVTGSGPSSIDSMQFHPYFPLLLTAGPSSTVSLYHVSPQPPNPNPLVTSLHIKNTPLHTAAFCRPTVNAGDDTDHSQDGTRIILSSRRRYFHVWSLSTGRAQKVSRPIFGSAKAEQKTMEAFKISPCGRYMGLIGSGKKGGGTINVLNTETMQWNCACRIDGRGGVADFCWWRDGNGFAVVGKNGEVSEFNVEAKRVVSRWFDEGAVGTTVIALGGESGRKGLGGDRWVAVGSSSGVVNIYDRREWIGSDVEIRIPRRPTPTRMLDQLTTSTSHLEFSDDGQMLAMGSRWKKNALRLIHLPSCTVYRNWPTDKTPLGRVSSIALSSNGGYLAVANEQGKIRLFQISD